MERKKVTFDTFVKQLGCISKYKKKYLFVILILNMIFACIIPFISALLPKVAIGLIEGRAIYLSTYYFKNIRQCFF